MKPINRIIVALESRNGRYYGFRFIRCADGAVVEGQISGGQSNILSALGDDGENWLGDYFWTTKETKESEIFALPYAGCAPGDIRAYVESNLPKLEVRP